MGDHLFCVPPTPTAPLHLKDEHLRSDSSLLQPHSLHTLEVHT